MNDVVGCGCVKRDDVVVGGGVGIEGVEKEEVVERGRKGCGGFL